MLFKDFFVDLKSIEYISTRIRCNRKLSLYDFFMVVANINFTGNDFRKINGSYLVLYRYEIIRLRKTILPLLLPMRISHHSQLFESVTAYYYCIMFH